MTTDGSSDDVHAEHRDRKRRKRMQLHGKASVYLMQQAIARAAERAASGEEPPRKSRPTRKLR